MFKIVGIIIFIKYIRELLDWLGNLPLDTLPERLQAWVRTLPAPWNRLHSPRAMDEADRLILGGFRATGWTAQLEPFEFPGVSGYVDYGSFGPTFYEILHGTNVVAYKSGASDVGEEIVVLGYHDTIRDSPGANDNAASVTSIHELARLIAPFTFQRTIVLAATDMEEIGFFGSRALVGSLLASYRILNAINYETMAYTSSEAGSQLLPPGLGAIYATQVSRIRQGSFMGDFTTIIYRVSSAKCAAQFASGLARLAGPGYPIMLMDPNDLPIIGPILSRTIPFVRQFARSDHVPFWEAGLPAIQVTHTANFRYHHYHQASDTQEKLDYVRLAHIIGATTYTLTAITGLLYDDA